VSGGPSPGDSGFEPGTEVLETESFAVGTVIDLGEEEALVRFPLLGDLWVPYDELLPGSVIGMD
jgi:hypothetical protein